VGDKVLIRDGIDTYECEVIEIKENTVVIKCREAEVTLKLTQASMIEN
jgi:preprotein translocase subunit YajC